MVSFEWNGRFTIGIFQFSSCCLIYNFTVRAGRDKFCDCVRNSITSFLPMSAVFKTLVLILSLYVVHWTIVKFDKRQNELGVEPTGTASLSLVRLLNSGVNTRKLLSVNSTALLDSKPSSEGQAKSTTKPNLPCIHFHKLNQSNQCKFIKTQSACQMSDGFFQYLQFAYCQLHSVPVVAFILLFLWLVLLFVMLGATADEYFCPSLTVIYKTLKISENIAGVTFLAYGNGAPDIFSAVAAFSGQRGGSAAGLAFNALFGAGIFVTTVVVGAISFTGPFTLTYRPFTRDVLFYLGAVAWAFITFNKENITLYEAIGYIVLYVVYVLTVVIGRYVYQRWKSRLRFLGNNGYLCAAGIEESLEHSPGWRGGSTSSESSEIEVNINRVPGDQTTLLNDSQEDEKPPKKKLHHNVAGALLATESTAVSFAAGVNVEPPTLAGDENTPLLGSGKVSSLTPWMKFWKGVQPWDDLEWRQAGILGRAFIIFKSPAILCLNLTVPVVDLDEDDQHWNKWLNTFHCLVDPVFCVFITRHAAMTIGGKLPLWSVMLAAGIILALIVALSTADDKPPRCHWVFAYIAFTVSVIWIYTTANEIVNLLETFGIAFKISDGILGLTFLAWGNSIGDFISDMAMARQGFPRMAISACFGGPLLNLLLGIGISCTIATATSGRDLMLRHDFNQYIISAGFLALSLASSAVAIPLMGFRIPRAYGAYLIFLYLAYLALSIAEELKHF